MTLTNKIGAAGILIVALGGWFGFAGVPPYASASDVVANTVVARTALQQAMENRTDAQQQRIFSYELFVATNGKSPERTQRLHEMKAKLIKYEDAKERAYK